MELTFWLVRRVLLAFSILLCAPIWAQTSQNSLVDTIAADHGGDPIPVGVGFRITQITGVDQKAENFSIVGRLRMEWKDPNLAFDPDIEGSELRVMATDDFVEFARGIGTTVPVLTYENQQTRSFIKQSNVVWDAQGQALHASEVILTLQAPDFNFRRYPFDEQVFYTRLLLTAPANAYEFVEIEDFSGMGDQLGEEQWIIRNVWSEIDTVPGLVGWESSRFSLVFSADRHQIYYWVRIFLPIILLIVVSWANLFLSDYRRRIDVAGANLLAFIAFNFTISGELPRLGYLTFLDALILAMFVISALAVAYNVMLHRMALAGLNDRAFTIDRNVTLWVYPAIFIVTLGYLFAVFLN